MESLLSQDQGIRNDVIIIFIPPEFREDQNIGRIHFNGRSWGVMSPYHTSTHDELVIDIFTVESPRRDIFMQHQCYFPLGCVRDGKLIYMINENILYPV
jgi:hypothetical protein